MTVAIIFKERPKRWGYRGDPYLWDDLEQIFNEINVPVDGENFKEKIYLSIEQCTGQRIEEGEDIDVEMYNHRGLSSGKISHAFWCDIAIPLLVKRLEIENKRIRNKYHCGRIIRFPTTRNE